MSALLIKIAEAMESYGEKQNNPEIPENESSNITIEGPIYINCKIKPRSNAFIIEPKTYFSVYLHGKINIGFDRDEGKKEFLNMDKNLVELAHFV